MTTNERIGRVDENVTFEKVTNHPGGRLSVDGKFAVGAGNEERLYTARDLLLAHVGNEFEPVIPFVSTVHPRWSGYYLLDDVQVDMGKGALDGMVEWPFSLELVPVTTKHRPLVESVLWGGPRQGRDGDEGSWWAVPASAQAIHTGWASSGAVPFVGSTWSGPGGTALVFWITGGNEEAGFFFDTRTSYVLLPENWYDMACTLRVGGQIVVGRQTLDAPNDWVLDNGLIRVESGTESLIRLVLPSGEDASTWGETVDIQVGYDSAGGGTTFAAVTEAVAIWPVRVRNEEVSIGLRCVIYPDGTSEGAAPAVETVYVTMRRGARHVTVTTATAGDSRAPAIWIDGEPTSTAIGTGADERGFYTAANSDGLRVVFGQSEAGGNVDTDQANSRVYTTAEQPMLEAGIGFSWDDDGSPFSVAAPDGMVAMWCAAMSETVMVRRGG